MSEKIWNRNFVSIFFAYFGIIISYMTLLPTFPIYVRDLGFTQDIVGFLTGVFTVTAILSRPVLGRKLDTSDRKMIYVAGAFISFIAIGSYYFIENMYLLMVMRLIHGIGIGITTSAANTIATDFIPKHRMGEGVGYFSFCTVIGMAMAPALGIYLVEHFGFAAVFFTSASAALMGVALGLLLRYSPEQKDAFRQMAAANLANKMTWSNMFERNALRPAITVLFAGASYNAVSSFLALYAESKGVANIGLYFTVYACALVFSRTFGGKVADRRGASIVIVPGLFVSALSVFLLYLANTLAQFLMIAVVFGLGFGLAQTALQTMAVTSVPASRRGAAVSTHFTGLDLSILLGSSMAGMFSRHFGYETMMLLLTFPMLFSLFMFFALGKWIRPRTASAGPAKTE
jgi:MFS family permease